MKSPSEIAREIAEEVLIKSGLYQRAGVWPDDIDDSKCLRLVTQAITTERQRQEMLVEALEKYGTHLSDCTTTPGDWCSCGLRKAQQVLKEVK